MTREREPRRELTTEELLGDILHELRFHGDALQKIENALAESARANEVPLYCPPTDFCDGGHRLYRHKEEYWKKDGKDADRYYHALPESAWFKYTGEGAMQGVTVNNHNVWRSQALTTGIDEQGDPNEAEFSEPDRAPEQTARMDWWTRLMVAGTKRGVTIGQLATVAHLSPDETVKEAVRRWLNANAGDVEEQSALAIILDLAEGVPA